jgi:hypothetical protein
MNFTGSGRRRVFGSAARLVCAALLFAACEPAEPEGGGEGGGTGGGTPEGGGGSGGDGDSGVGGGVVPGPCDTLSEDACATRDDCAFDGEDCTDAEGAACANLGEAQCDARLDCFAREDVFGDFARCLPVGEALCHQLDTERCASRDDCEVRDGACQAPEVPCADHAGDRAACEAAACFWYADTCNETAEPGRCDQPDEASCVAADCAWSNARGCTEPMPSMECEDLGMAACTARPDCLWDGNACTRDPGEIPCAELDMLACAVRNDCAFDPSTGTCGERPDGGCNALDEQSCRMRPDCEAVFGPTDCDCGGEVPAPDCPPGEMCDPPQCVCPEAFVSCQPRVADCGNVPAEVCDATPGCHLEEGCAPCPEGQICPAICEIVVLCVADAPNACDGLDPDTCRQRQDCRLEEQVVCDPAMGGGAEPPPPDGDRIIAPPCGEVQLVCVPAGPQPGDCFAYLDAATCFSDPACEWFVNGGAPDGGGGMEPVPFGGEDCACAPDQPDCGCGGGAVPPFPGEGFCGFRQVIFDPCGMVDPALCDQTPGCASVGQVDCPPCEPGVPCADCVPAQCVTVDQLCANYFDAASCDADDRCVPENFEVCNGGGFECPPGRECPPPEPPVCEVWFQCLAAPSPCDGLPVDACLSTPGCHIEEFGAPGVCECRIDANGREVCECFGGEPVQVCMQDEPGQPPVEPQPEPLPPVPAPR